MSNENQEIVELIKKSGYSVRKIARDLKIPEGRIYGWTNKNAKPTYEDGQKIREYFGVKKEEPKMHNEVEAALHVVMIRLTELLAAKSGRTALIEFELLKKEIQDLARLRS